MSSVVEDPFAPEEMPATEPAPPSALRLRELALAAIARTIPRTAPGREQEASEEAILRESLEAVERRARSLPNLLRETLASPAVEDRRLVELGRTLELAPLEILTVALAAAVEDDLLTGRLLAHVQAPIGRSRPTVGLVLQALGPLASPGSAALATLLEGHAMQAGLLRVTEDSLPAPERALQVPLPTCLALQGHEGRWPDVTLGLAPSARIPLSASTRREATRQAKTLRASPQLALLLRSGSPAEARTTAAAVAEALGLQPAFLERAEHLEGMTPWLLLRRLLPVFILDLSPGERHLLAELPRYEGPVLIVAGPDGSVERAAGAVAEWTLPTPAPGERQALWRDAIKDRKLAEHFGAQFRHGSGRIHHLGQLARREALLAGRDAIGHADILAASWSGEAGGLDALAQPLRATVPDEALITTPVLRASLEALLRRCRHRDGLTEGLGPSARTRYQPGVRALFTGSSGTGKTLAAGWIATRLGLPLYRIDLASVTSKYIGETEKNLSQLLARAEQAEVVLLFDEADSLFGKRTDISDANDRFANAQTNYLLQRIENYDGIVLLTSNSQTRFDPAFTRRLDCTIEFPSPGPEERRALWLSHLGPHPALAPAELNQLAVLLDLTGGHIRNVVLSAAVLAREGGRAVSFPDIVAAATFEYRKLGRQLPKEFKPV